MAAIQRRRRFSRRLPLTTKPHIGLAYALLRQGKLLDAQSEAEKALTINPKSVDANYTMGVINLRVGANESAIKIPGTLDGKPVSMYIQLEYNFNLY